MMNLSRLSDEDVRAIYLAAQQRFTKEVWAIAGRNRRMVKRLKGRPTE